MKTSLNQKISTLSAAFHKGDISLADYRAERRKEFDALNNLPQDSMDDSETPRLEGVSKGVVKRIVFGTGIVIFLIITTVMIAKFVF